MTRRKATSDLLTPDQVIEGRLVDLFDHDELPVRGGEAKVELGAYGFRWLRARRPGRRLAR